MRKKADRSRQKSDRPITLIVTVYPPKKDKRRILISAAPDGEMPLMFSGLFPDRHALLDRAFAGVLKRMPQVVTVKEAKPIKAEPDKAEEETDWPATEASDQLVTNQESESAVPVSPITGTIETTEETSGQLIALSEREESTEQLPLIEGDEVDTDEVGNDG